MGHDVFEGLDARGLERILFLSALGVGRIKLLQVCSSQALGVGLDVFDVLDARGFVTILFLYVGGCAMVQSRTAFSFLGDVQACLAFTNMAWLVARVFRPYSESKSKNTACCAATLCKLAMVERGRSKGDSRCRTRNICMASIQFTNSTRKVVQLPDEPSPKCVHLRSPYDA